MTKIRILLADDHTILRDGIRSLLGDEPDMVVIGEAEDGRTAVKMTCQTEPDVVLMDIAMPLLNGLDATRQIKQCCFSRFWGYRSQDRYDQGSRGI